MAQKPEKRKQKRKAKIAVMQQSKQQKQNRLKAEINFDYVNIKLLNAQRQ